MTWIALKMLMGDRAKYIGILAGITFSALLIAQQASIFCGLLLRTAAQIQDISDADIWVMDPGVEYVDELKAMSDGACLKRAASMASPGLFGSIKARRTLKLEPDPKYPQGTFQQVILLGLDDGTMVGAPRTMIEGKLSDLREPDAVIMDIDGYKYLWPNEPVRLGREFEMNDHRAVLVGICKSAPTFQTFPVIYTRYSQAMTYVPPERRVLSFVLVQPEPGIELGGLV